MLREFKSGSIGSFLSRTPSVTVRLSEDAMIVISHGYLPETVPYRDIIAINWTPWMLGWGDLKVTTRNGAFEAKRLSAIKAEKLPQHLLSLVQSDLANAIHTGRNEFEYFNGPVQSLLEQSGYLADRDRKVWLRTYVESVPDSQRVVLEHVTNPLLELQLIDSNMRRAVSELQDLALGQPDRIKARNQIFVEQELEVHKTFFDQVEKHPLTEEQRRAAVVMEDRNLLVAPAGSGKTSALIGKIGYALKSGLYKPSDILVVAFNSSARDELKTRIVERLSGFEGIGHIQVHTFHSLGQQIISKVSHRKPSIHKTAEDDFARGKLFQEIFDHLLTTDPVFHINNLFFRVIYPSSVPDPASFKTIEAWGEHLRHNGQTVGGKSGFRTLASDLVKSQGEQAIANWLFVYGIEYEYERNYEYETADQEHRQYKPDFYFPAIGVYLEHYALTANGHPPAAFGKKYAESIEWKRSLHDEKQTECWETTFAEFVDGTLFEKLQRAFQEKGIELNLRTDAEMHEIIKKKATGAKPLPALLSSAARHAKSNFLGEDAITNAAINHRERARAKLFAKLLLPVMAEYEQRLRATKEIDFEDMIGLAVESLGANTLDTPFGLVLVDEFQDISRARARLVRAILEQRADAKLFAVGDDWQAIYRFAGSDISLFWDFEQFFGPTEKMFLTRTFRFNQGVADISAHLVSKNPDQQEKQVISVDNRSSKVVGCFIAETEDGEKVAFLSILKKLAQARAEDNKPIQVLVLARYRKVLQKADSWLDDFSSPAVQTRLMTIHRSKGLEADYVIILGLNSRPLSFPSTLDDDPLLQIVLPKPETYSSAEERRLFYVAITRTKNVVYTIGTARMVSPFVSELAKDWNDSEELQRIYIGSDGRIEANPDWCPKCHTGILRDRSSRYGDFKGCSRSPHCQHKIN